MINKSDQTRIAWEDKGNNTVTIRTYPQGDDESEGTSVTVNNLGHYLVSQNQSSDAQGIWAPINQLGEQGWELIGIENWNGTEGKGHFTKLVQGGEKWEYIVAPADRVDQKVWVRIDFFEEESVAFFKKRQPKT
jgi:hypothetical protein